MSRIQTMVVVCHKTKVLSAIASATKYAGAFPVSIHQVPIEDPFHTDAVKVTMRFSQS